MGRSHDLPHADEPGPKAKPTESMTKIVNLGLGKDLQVLEKGNVDVLEFTQDEWVQLPKPLVVDSGAGETVLPADWLTAHPTLEGRGAKDEDYYQTADGT